MGLAIVGARRNGKLPKTRQSHFFRVVVGVVETHKPQMCESTSQSPRQKAVISVPDLAMEALATVRQTRAPSLCFSPQVTGACVRCTPLPCSLLGQE